MLMTLSSFNFLLELLNKNIYCLGLKTTTTFCKSEVTHETEKNNNANIFPLTENEYWLLV